MRDVMEKVRGIVSSIQTTMSDLENEANNLQSDIEQAFTGISLVSAGIISLQSYHCL